MVDSITQKAGIITLPSEPFLCQVQDFQSLWPRGLPEGFKKGDLAPEPSADIIQAGKRVYFTKCVWCHGETARVRTWSRSTLASPSQF